MKDVRTYERKVKKLLSGAKKGVKTPSAGKPEELLFRIVEAVFLADATDAEADKAMSAIQKEFVDYNELRVAPEKDILECIGKDHPLGRHKVPVLHSVLNGLYEKANRLSAEYMIEMSKRDIRRHLRELGMTSFGEAIVAMLCFGVHAIPVDDSLRYSLMINEMIHESADVNETQSFLEKLIPQKDGYAAHLFFRQFVAKNAKALDKKRKEDADRQAAEEEAKRLVEEEKARKEAEEAEKKAQAEAERLAQEKEKQAAAKKASAKKPAPKAARKPVKKESAKPAGKAKKKK